MTYKNRKFIINHWRVFFTDRKNYSKYMIGEPLGKSLLFFKYSLLSVNWEMTFSYASRVLLSLFLRKLNKRFYNTILQYQSFVIYICWNLNRTITMSRTRLPSFSVQISRYRYFKNRVLQFSERFSPLNKYKLYHLLIPFTFSVGMNFLLIPILYFLL